MKAWRGGVPGCYAICVVVMAANRSQEKNRLRKKDWGYPSAGTKTGAEYMGRSARWPYIRRMAWDRDRKNRSVCHICNQRIDYSLKPSSADDSWEPDHVIPVSKRPDLELDLNNVRASHKRCNRARGDGTNGENVIGMQSRVW